MAVWRPPCLDHAFPNDVPYLIVVEEAVTGPIGMIDKNEMTKIPERIDAILPALRSSIENLNHANRLVCEINQPILTHKLIRAKEKQGVGPCPSFMKDSSPCTRVPNVKISNEIVRVPGVCPLLRRSCDQFTIRGERDAANRHGRTNFNPMANLASRRIDQFEDRCIPTFSRNCDDPTVGGEGRCSVSVIFSNYLA